MGRYDDLLTGRIGDKVLDDLYPLAPSRISDLLKRHPEIPKDFVDFLQEIGAGTLGPDRYSIYSGLVDAKELLGEAETFDCLALFGDDFGGVSHGFAVRGWHMVEIDSSLGVPKELDTSFEKFIRNMIEVPDRR
ncbi:hypothetical protein NIBR502774_19735 (plasmid) [Rhizobium sp. NIBRBAC000502774]|nr:hypothetical protein NIBR502774_19735 [Rhizobium sp. NIBRBAC000502774]